VAAVNQAVRVKAAVASLGAAAKVAVEVAEEAVVAVAAGAEARGEQFRPILLPSSKLGSLCPAKQCSQRLLQSLIRRTQAARSGAG
jgi:hypothetical protein